MNGNALPPPAPEPVAPPPEPPPEPPPAPAPQSVWRRRLRRWLPLIVACSIIFAIEHSALEHLGGSDETSPLTRRLFDASASYGYVVSTWPRTMRPRYTAIVHISPESDLTAYGLAGNRCQQRDYVAELLPALARLKPSMIVIDIYYTRRGCTQEAPTQRLVAAVNRVGSEKPVVVALKIDERAQAGAGPTLLPPVAFGDLPALRQGLADTDAMVERIPLGWTVRPAADAAPRWHDSLSLAAALVREPRLAEKAPRLRSLKDEREHPYASLIPADRFMVLPAGALLCNDAETAPRFAAGCRGAALAANLDELRDRIVVVGETGTSVDQHSTGMIGVVSGTVLQANYIEALLDERYFLPVPGWLDYLLGLLVFVALERALQQRSAWRALAGAGVVVVATFVALCFVARVLGYYVGPSVGALTLLFMLIGWLKETLMHREASDEH